MAARTGAVNHAIQLAPLAGDYRHHETLVANGDEFLLQQPFFAVRLEKAFERLLDRLFLALDIAPQAGQRDAGVIGHAAVGKDLAVQIAQQRAKIADGGRAASQPRKALGGRGEHRFGIGRAVQQREHVEDFLRLQPGAFNA